MGPGDPSEIFWPSILITGVTKDEADVIKASSASIASLIEKSVSYTHLTLPTICSV